MRADRRQRAPHRPALKLPTAVRQTDRPGKEFAEIAGQMLGKAVESHLRELLERGFEVVVAADATAAAKLPGLDGMLAALINFTMLASDVWTTSTAVDKMATAAAEPACTA
jgi:hypothetical protein